jgi:hypothetical protein
VHTDLGLNCYRLGYGTSLETEFYWSYIWRFSPYRAVNTLRLFQLMLYREIIAGCSEIHTEHTNILCGQNVGFVDVKPGGTYSDRWTLQG